MSIFYKFSCEKCGYEENINLGSGGYWYARVYPQIISSAIDGEFGADIQKIFKEHHHSAVVYSKVLAECGNCGRYENVLDVAVYLPKDNGLTNEGKFLNRFNIEKNYNCVARFEHKCNFCGGAVEIFNEDTFDVEKTTLQCPNCQSLMVGDFGGTWD